MNFAEKRRNMRIQIKIIKEVIFTTLLGITSVFSQNPIVPNMGLNDPHIRIFNNTAYVYASHDKSIDNKEFIMENWWVWSSSDLVHWTKESVLSPEQTYIGAPFNRCWATDAAHKNGKYYWYFSEGNEQTGVVVGSSPVGPWEDVLGKPFLSSDLTPTHEYDISIFEENGNHYVIFGVWDFYIARLNDDMVSLAEKPKKISINNPRGPYNQDGKNTEKPTDDKPFVHQYNGKYYLSWGCFYAMSDNLYGPYNYVDSVIKEESFAEGYDAPTWPNGFLQGRHGSFFEWHNQWYYVYCDISQTGNRYFRDSFISYVHYKENGEIATIRVDGTGVANYNANQPIQAEEYFKAIGIEKKPFNNGFVVQSVAASSSLCFTNIKGLADKSTIEISALTPDEGTFSIQVRRSHAEGVLLGSTTFVTKGENASKDISIKLSAMQNEEDVCLLITSSLNTKIQIDSFKFLN